MRPSARHKLNHYHLKSIVVTAAVFAAIAGSLPLFIVITIILIVSSVFSGDIRLRTTARRNG